MLRGFKIAPNLQSTILAVIRGVPTPQQVDTLVRVTQAVALQIIRSKRSAGLAQGLQGLSDSDLALDCVADLFRQDEQGQFVGLKAYFASLDVVNADDAESLVFLRRLVASAVNQGLFRVLNEGDPALGKILRNIKLAVQALRHFEEVDVFGESCIVPILCDSNDHLPVLDREQIVFHLSDVARGNERIPGLLALLSSVLRNQKEFSRVVPIVSVGLAFRDLYAQKGVDVAPSTVAEQPPIWEDHVSELERACERTKARMTTKYVVKGKVHPHLFEAYFQAILKFLGSKSNGNGNDLTLFESLSGVLPGLPHREYRRAHRGRLEYLARLVQDEWAKTHRN